MSDTITSEIIFNRLPEYFRADQAAGVEGIFQFDITGENGGQWYVEVKDSACRVEKGAHPNPSVTITMDAADHVAISLGKLDGPAAFFSGRLRVSGDMLLGLRFSQLFKRS